ncbi:chromatin assembly factor 1, p105 subunit [Nomia melanderi]|uniref:chromatin assembly factor 1, p105 subunit n=1 Tax=Nomia melanderi TaxID=2448451 RepID=UPI0013040C8F|nr:chromatin assembly factor 1 subunit B [Nomia melanderi]XP_031833329.1 chromatin assembly factor 1 subunit B [Nomia melanderi]XP_031833330.1 chromatin assembly factor 1 subunit B [Nomia melanderi]XP_031833331.1 chromatin assembly factor 1 subunit B [Nomia melanderi]
MWCTTPEISWHNRDPVLSIDVQAGIYETSKGETFWRIATGGADSHVLIWYIITNEFGGANVKCVADLERHQKAVNVVRFSPSKEILASGDDESTILLWKQKEDCEFHIISDDAENKEQWMSWKVLRGHLEDVYDISWSPDSNMLVSGSVDNTAILWDIHKGRSTAILTEHKGFVQGVSWDPCNQYICTISTDRICRLIDINTKKTVQRVYKAKIPTPPDHPLKDKTVRLFYDDTFKSFFRRLTFSLDGMLIIVPSGIIDPLETTERISNATIVFSRHNLKEPLMLLPSLDESTIAVRCCPIYFELQENGPTSMIALPYRIVFAVATQHSVFIYDTQQISPIAVISNIHYTRLTDVSWSSDGGILIVSSTDGYCSIIRFQKGELGTEYKGEFKTPMKHTDNSNCKKSAVSSKTNDVTKRLSAIDIDNNAMDIDISVTQKTEDLKDSGNAEEESNKLNQVTVQEQKLNNQTDIEETEDIKLIYNDESTSKDVIGNTKNTSKESDTHSTIPAKVPRRVQLITLSSPKGHKNNSI